MPESPSSLIFLDRDGTLNYDPGYIHEPDKVKLLDGVISGLKRLQAHYRFVVISNQSGIARGYYGHDEVIAVNKRIEELLKLHNIIIERFYYCPHLPEDNCACRKPMPTLLYKAADELAGDINNSWMVGDKTSDIEAGKAAGTRTIFLSNNNTEANTDPDFTAADLLEAAEIILREDGHI